MGIRRLLRFRLVLIGVLLLGMLAVWKVAHRPARALSPEAKEVARGNTAFALDLYRTLRVDGENLFFSPYSVSAALGMLYGGAQGDTATEMAGVLHIGLDPETFHPASAELLRLTHHRFRRRSVQVQIANSLWCRQGAALPSYTRLLRKCYDATVHPVDFAGDPEGARQEINTWTAKRTNRRIQELFGPGMLDPATTLVLANAVYFRGKWDCQFDPSDTRPVAFHLLDGTTKQVPMMFQAGDSFDYYKDRAVQVLGLPYRGGRLAMFVVLPCDPAGLPAVEEQLSPGTLSRWIDRAMRMELLVYIPKFRLSWEGDLKEPLADLGMPLAFVPGADFSAIDGTRDPYVSAVRHQAVVDVDEEGTEAAAATSAALCKSAPAESFYADHPFLFFIYDRLTDSILFLGRVVDPVPIEN